MRVCQITHSFLPHSVGGREIHILNLSLALAEAGCQVEIVTGDNVRRPEQETLAPGVTVTRLPVITIPLARKGAAMEVIYRIIPGLPGYLRRSPAQILHAQDYFHLSSDMTAWVSRMTGRPMVLTIHSRHGFFSVNTPLKLLESVYDATLGAFTLRQAQKVIFMSRRSAQDFVERGLPARKTAIIHPAVQVADFEPVYHARHNGHRSFFQERLGLRPGPVLLAAGRIERRKGFRYLIQALPYLLTAGLDVQAVIAGEDKGTADDLRDIADGLGLAERVTFTGYLTDHELMEAMRDADVFILPSDNENFPEVAVRAMCLGRPVVASRVGGVPELIEHGINGLLVPPGDAVALSQALAQLLTQPELAQRLGQQGRDKVLQEHTMQAMAAKTIQVYHQVLEGRRAEPVEGRAGG